MYGITLVAAAASKLHLDSHRSFKYTPSKVLQYSTSFGHMQRITTFNYGQVQVEKFEILFFRTGLSNFSTRGCVDCAVILPLQRGCPGCEATSSVRHVTLPHGLTIQLTIENQESEIP